MPGDNDPVNQQARLHKARGIIDRLHKEAKWNDILKNVEKMRETDRKQSQNMERKFLEYDTLVNTIREDNIQLINESKNTELDVDRRVQNAIRRAESAEAQRAIYQTMMNNYHEDLGEARQDFQQAVLMAIRWKMEQLE